MPKEHGETTWTEAMTAVAVMGILVFLLLICAYVNTRADVING